jgi:hypothetical protein
MFYVTLLMLLGYRASQAAAPCQCEPAAAIEKAAAASSGDRTDFDHNVGPFLELRNRFPDDLLVNEQYQDAVARHGIEGHLKELAAEYQVLSIKHPGEAKYQYLFLRSLMGRSTPAAVRGLAEMVAEDGNFAPAHKTLAEIYGAPAFHDAEKQKVETERFLALCPRSRLTVRPDPLPDPSPLLDQAEQLLARNGDPDKIIAMTAQAMTDDEWRNQRIRAFDWYTVDFKRRSLTQLREKYWRAWACEVRSHRKAGRVEDADSLLALMEQRVEALRKQPAPAYWNASMIIARLYVEARQPHLATKIIDRLQQYLTEKPDPDNTRVLEDLRKEISRLQR